MSAFSYLELRRRTGERNRSLRDKVMSLEEAACLVKDGASIAVGGSLASRTPFAMIWALARARRRDLVVSRSIMSTEGDIILASGLSRHVVTSWFGQGMFWGLSKIMRAQTESGRVRYEEWSHMAMGLRYRAGAMGLPFMPMRSMIGSDIMQQAEGVQMIECPFTGAPLVLVPALNPDVAIIHVHRCDRFGNAQIDGLDFMDVDIALAANSVILTTERIVSNDQIRREPDRTKIGFFTVDAVIEVPFGCAPHECYGCYEPVFSQMDLYSSMTRNDAEMGAQDYLDRFYYEPENWLGHLGEIGMDEILDASRRGKRIYDD